jgi:hypothetical protein
MDVVNVVDPPRDLKRIIPSWGAKRVIPGGMYRRTVVWCVMPVMGGFRMNLVRGSGISGLAKGTTCRRGLMA